MAIAYGNLTNYVDQLSQPLISQAVLEAQTAKYIDIISGVKYAQQINILDINPFIVQNNNAASNGFTDSGTTILSAVTAVACPLKIQNSFVLEGTNSLESIWYGQLLKKGSYTESAPSFEEAFMKQLQAYVSQSTDAALWMGGYVPVAGATAHSADTSSVGTYLASCQGILFNAYNTSMSGATIKVTYSGAPNSTTIYNIVDTIVGSIPNNMLMLPNISIWCQPQYIDMYKRALINANNFHYFVQGSEATSDLNITIPGRSNITLRGTPGLAALGVAGTNNTNGYQGFVASNDDNLALICDLESDTDKTIVWFSNDFDQLRATTKFKAGGIAKLGQQVIVY